MPDKLLCPFDNTPLKRFEDHYNNPYFCCPTCKQEYSRYQVDDLEGEKQKRIEAAREELPILKKKEQDLVAILSLVEDTHKI